MKLYEVSQVALGYCHVLIKEEYNTAFEKIYRNREQNFANAREVRNFFETAVLNQANRLFNIKNPTDQELCTIEIEDVERITTIDSCKDDNLSKQEQINNIEYTPELLQKAIQEFALSKIKDCTFKNEETNEIIRIHLFSTDNNKVGAVKIQKSNLAIQFRRIQNGKPEIFDTNSLDELLQHIQSII